MNIRDYVFIAVVLFVLGWMGNALWNMVEMDNRAYRWCFERGYPEVHRTAPPRQFFCTKRQNGSDIMQKVPEEALTE